MVFWRFIKLWISENRWSNGSSNTDQSCLRIKSDMRYSDIDSKNNNRILSQQNITYIYINYIHERYYDMKYENMRMQEKTEGLKLKIGLTCLGYFTLRDGVYFCWNGNGVKRLATIYTGQLYYYYTFNKLLYGSNDFSNWINKRQRMLSVCVGLPGIHEP